MDVILAESIVRKDQVGEEFSNLIQDLMDNFEGRFNPNTMRIEQFEENINGVVHFGINLIERR